MGGRQLDDALNKDNKRVAEILREFGAKFAADSDEGGGVNHRWYLIIFTSHSECQ